MKIILSNYRYFVSGGPEKYMFAIQDMLQARGHKVLPFSVRSMRNLACDHHERFLSPIGNGDAAYFHEYKRTLANMLKVLSRQVYCPEAFIKARSYAQFCDAELVYSLQFLNKMSPALLDGFKSAGLPVVLRVSDFGLICPQGHLFDGNSVCESCLGGNFLHTLTKRCVVGSFAGGLIKAVALKVQRLIGCYDRIDAYVFPSRFTMERFAQAGFPKQKLHYVPTFIDYQEIGTNSNIGEHILYFGRLVKEKGVHHLLQAYCDLPADKPKLIVIGAQGNTPYAKAQIENYTNDVEFHDFMSKEKLAQFVKRALFVVIPSIWYDNLPNVLLEAYANGKPVIAPQHGCFIDLVQDGETGLFYKAGDVADLREKLLWAINSQKDMERMGSAARDVVETKFSPKRHYRELMTVFSKVL